MKPTEERDEEEAFAREALRRVLDGDVESFAAIVETYRRAVAADLARRLAPQDVQEVAQDTFVRAYRSLASFRGEAPLRIWLLRIARRAAMDFWRKRYRRKEKSFSDLEDGAMEHIERNREEDLAQRRKDVDAQDAAREWLEAALNRLSPDDRAIIVLVELENRTMEEAARHFGCGLSAVKVRAFRARRRLKGHLEALRTAKEDNP